MFVLVLFWSDYCCFVILVDLSLSSWSSISILTKVFVYINKMVAFFCCFCFYFYFPRRVILYLYMLIANFIAKKIQIDRSQRYQVLSIYLDIFIRINKLELYSSFICFIFV